MSLHIQYRQQLEGLYANNGSTALGLNSFYGQWENACAEVLFAYINRLENDVAAYKKELADVSYQLERLADKCRV